MHFSDEEDICDKVAETLLAEERKQVHLSSPVATHKAVGQTHIVASGDRSHMLPCEVVGVLVDVDSTVAVEIARMEYDILRVPPGLSELFVCGQT